MELRKVDQHPLATKLTIPPIYLDLRLTVDEARIFLNQIMNLSLTDQQVADLCRRTGGWIAGVRLVALSLIECDDGSDVQHRMDTFGCKDIGRGGLSEREYCVLQLVSEGLSNQEIARNLVVAVSTVKTHLNNIYAKFRVHTRLQAVTKAYDLGLLSPWVGVDPERSENGHMPLN